MDCIYIALFKRLRVLYNSPIHSFILTFTHWWKQATIVAIAALGQTDRSEAAILLHWPLWAAPVGGR